VQIEFTAGWLKTLIRRLVRRLPQCLAHLTARPLLAELDASAAVHASCKSSASEQRGGRSSLQTFPCVRVRFP
jgi:hypothetical protein